MRLTATRLAVLGISIAVVCSGCKHEDTPTEPLEGSWSLFSGYIESQLEIHSTNIITDPFPCFYDDQASSPSTTTSNRLKLNTNQTGSFSWNIRCTPAESLSFTWRLSGNNQLTLEHVSGETWVWKITSLSSAFMEIDFSRERNIELPQSGPATQHENISLKFKKVE